MRKTVLITGASKGIGFALTQRFLDNDYNVIGTSRTGKIENFKHSNLKIYKLDLSNQETITDIDKLFENENIEIDILINNAGIGPDLDNLNPDRESYKQTFEVNVTGTMFFTELMCRHIKLSGKIINISSKMGSIELCNLPDSVAYRMSKSALNMYSKILSNRLVGKQTVASLHPGWVRTTISKDNIVNGRLSTEESAIKIFDFVISDFETGIFWNAEINTKIEW